MNPTTDTSTHLLDCQVSPTEITVGDEVLLTCEGLPLNSASTKVTVDASRLGENAIGILSEVQAQDSKWSVTITAYRPQRHELGQLRFESGGQVFAPRPLDLLVKSILPPEATPTPFDITAPDNISYPLWWWILWGLLVAVVGGAIGRWWFKRRALKKQLAEQTPQRILSPKEKFEHAVMRLDSKGFHRRGEFKSFAFELTTVMKNGIRESTGLKVEDLTTEELFSELSKKQRKLWGAHEREFRVLFEELDKIKFAKVDIHGDDCQRLVDLALNVGKGLFG